MNRADLLVTGIGQLATPRGTGPVPGSRMDLLELVPNAAVAVRDGLLVAAGPEEAVRRDWEGEEIDVAGRLVTPGLVDPHTHFVFAGTREQEYADRIRGRSYREIAAAGGGIRASVRTLRKTHMVDLAAQSRRRLDRMLARGTTTAEVKTGYGLTAEDELKMLRAIGLLKVQHPVELVVSFLGAHEFPDEFRSDREGYLDLLVRKMIPEAVAEGGVEFCDVFCEEGVYSVEESRRVLLAAKEHGLKLKLHAEEFEPIGGALLAAELGAVSADHLVAVDTAGMDAMKSAGVIPVLLPGTSLHVTKRYAPAREMIDRDLPVALATDCNPGSCYMESLPLAAALACLQLRMTPDEALTAMTLNAAAALGRADQIGSVEPGKQADLVAWEARDFREIPYHFGGPDVHTVWKRGRAVHPDPVTAVEGAEAVSKG